MDYDDYIVYNQYDQNLDGKGGILFLFNDDCAQGFVELEIGNGVSPPAGVVFLGKNPDDVRGKNTKLCFSTKYTITMMLEQKSGNASSAHCPFGWNKVGYKNVTGGEEFEEDRVFYQVCAF